MDEVDTKKMNIICNLRKLNKKIRASPGVEPGTSRTLSENHAPRPTGQLQTIVFVLR